MKTGSSVVVVGLILAAQLLAGCTEQRIDDIRMQYEEEVVRFATDPEMSFLTRVNPIGTSERYADSLTDSLKILPPKNSIFQKWLNDPDVIDLTMAHLYWTDKTISTDPYAATFKGMTYEQDEYLMKYSGKKNIRSYSYDLDTINGDMQAIHVESWIFTEPPVDYFSDKAGYVKVELTLTNPGVQISGTYFSMLIMIPREE